MVGSEQFRSPIASMSSPSRRPLMVGSERRRWSKSKPASAVAVPSWSGRNMRQMPQIDPQNISRRPLIVGSEPGAGIVCCASSTNRRPLMVGSERSSWQTRGRHCFRSPSPHGRVGTERCESAVANLASRRPLMVGSELALQLAQEQWETESPSPHGRVGTERGLLVRVHPETVAVPSWSGRNPLRGGVAFGRGGVAVPSWSGRNCRRREGLVAGIRVAVPSWSGRNQWAWMEEVLRFLVAVPSWSGRNP